MMTSNSVFGSTPETSAVLMKMMGHRTVAQKVMEYYGIQKEDLVKHKKLKAMGVKHTERLAELGVSKQAFDLLFEDVLDPTENDNGIEGAGVGGSVSPAGTEDKPSVANPVKGTGKHKK